VPLTQEVSILLPFRSLEPFRGQQVLGPCGATSPGLLPLDQVPHRAPFCPLTLGRGQLAPLLMAHFPFCLWQILSLFTVGPALFMTCLRSAPFWDLQFLSHALFVYSSSLAGPSPRLAVGVQGKEAWVQRPLQLLEVVRLKKGQGWRGTVPTSKLGLGGRT
jgi:hypothetical protein